MTKELELRIIEIRRQITRIEQMEKRRNHNKEELAARIQELQSELLEQLQMPKP